LDQIEDFGSFDANSDGQGKKRAFSINMTKD